jgi:hypothetical protein
MLKNNPVLKDRLKALGAFSGIAIAAVAGFELVIGGGFDFLLPGQEIREVAPSSYVQVVDTPWADRDRLVPLTSTEYLFAGEASPLPQEALEGGIDAEDALRGRGLTVDEDDLYANIDALYRRSEAQDYAVSDVGYDANSEVVDDEPYLEEAPYEDAEPLDDGAADAAADEEPYVLYVEEKAAN